jgi:DNA-binding response OmpR family regulator
MEIGHPADRAGFPSATRTLHVGIAHNGDMPTVLVVEDEQDIRELLRRYLEREGLSVLTAATGADALRLLDSGRPDLMVLDLGLPDIDGEELLHVCAGSTPVLVLTARSSVEDRIAGLRAGADDYVVKPFSPTEVVLRVRSVLGRAGRWPGGGHHERSFGRGVLRIDEARHEAAMGDRPLSLTPSEWSLLVALAGDPGRVFSRRELVELVSGYTYEGYERAIDTHVKNLRHKLGPDSHDIVQTVVGFGYRLGLDADG